MTFLLKVVQGANAGAEIALPAGSTVSVGRGDACDIILTDAALPEKACELEVTGERVMMIFPDGKQARMEDYHVRFIGTTALAVGPAEGVWKALVWPDAHPVTTTAENGTSAQPTAAPISTVTKSSKRHVNGIFILLLLFILLAIVGGVGVCYFSGMNVEEKVTQLKAMVGWGDVTPETVEPLPPPETLEDIAKEYHLKTQITEAGSVLVVGDFTSRADRLNATARIYRVCPGAELDFCDVESLTVAIENLLALVTEGRMRLKALDGRIAYLEGTVTSESDLRRILEALRADVPKVERADCSHVTQGSPVGHAENEGGPANVVAEAHHQKASTQPAMPIVGILTQPYPCLVLQDGSRVMEGARLGGYTIETIAADRVVLSGAEGHFTWRP